MSSRDVKLNLRSADDVTIFSKTPSIGGTWSTHPSLKYSSEQNGILGEKSVFAKVSLEDNILVEKDNLKKMKPHLSVPEVLEVYKSTEEDITELQEMKPRSQIGALLVEEFIDSVSLGHAVVEERIDIDSMVAGVLEILKKMHRFCVHRDLKHSHIRINMDASTCKNLTFGLRQQLNLDIKGFSVIDVETTQMQTELSDDLFEDYIKRDITQLLTSITGYMSTLELDTEDMRRIFPAPIESRLERFGALLDILSEDYVMDVPDRLLTRGITTDFLKSKLGI